MGCTSDATAREARQARAGKAVWGLLFLVMGSLFMLDEMGRIDLKGPGPYPASHAVDGDPGTRWSSEWSDPQWITVDLGSVAEITRVRLSWESAFARTYRIETSVDGVAFTPVKEITNAKGGVDDHPVHASGRHVRIYGMERATQYGYSLWEARDLRAAWAALTSEAGPGFFGRRALALAPLLAAFPRGRRPPGPVGAQGRWRSADGAGHRRSRNPPPAPKAADRPLDLRAGLASPAHPGRIPHRDPGPPPDGGHTRPTPVRPRTERSGGSAR